jgi:protein-L-isoaspartate(D-aspartate) O-methyltransferase
VELSAYVKLDHVAPGPAPEDKAMIAVTFFDDERREIGHHILGPFTGSRDWHEEKKKIVVPNKAREGILRLGMFGATGEMDVDRVQIRKLGR